MLISWLTAKVGITYLLSLTFKPISRSLMIRNYNKALAYIVIREVNVLFRQVRRHTLLTCLVIVCVRR